MTIKEFLHDESGAGLVEYAVALIVVTLAGAAVFTLGENISDVLETSADAF